MRFPEAGGPSPASTFLLSDGRGGASQLTVGGFPARDFHAAYLPGPGFGTSLRWASPGLGLELAGREMWLPEDPEEFAALPADVRLESFDEGPLPRWRYALGEARLEVELAAQHGEAAVILRVRIFGARPGTKLLLRPAFSAGPVVPGESPRFQAMSAGETPRSRSVRGQGGTPTWSGSIPRQKPSAVPRGTAGHASPGTGSGRPCWPLRFRPGSPHATFASAFRAPPSPRRARSWNPS